MRAVRRVACPLSASCRATPRPHGSTARLPFAVPLPPAAEPVREARPLPAGRGGPPQAGRAPGRVLANRNFAPFFAGSLLSNCGTWLQNVAQTLLVYRLTGSTLLVGVVNFAQFAGVILLAPWSGPAADRVDRRRLAMAMQVAAMAVTATLAAVEASGHATVPVVVGLAMVLGCTTAFATPALQALVPSLVGREEVGAAVAMNSLTFNLARAVGPAVGALVVARCGLAWAFGLNSLSYAALVAALLVIRPAAQPANPPGRGARLRDSLGIVRAKPHLALLLGVVAAVSVAADPVTTLSPAFATRVFGRPDTLAGYLIAVFGAGAVAASFLPMPAVERADGVSGARAVAAPLGVLVAGIAGFALAPSVALAYAALAVAGAGFLAAQTRATALLQLSVSDGERGRVMALWSVAFLGSRPLASLADGVLASAVGPRGAALALAVPALVVAAVLGRARAASRCR